VIVVARRPQQKAAALALGADRVVDDGDPGGLGATPSTRPSTSSSRRWAARPTRSTPRSPPAGRAGPSVILGAFTRAPTFPALFVLAKELRLIGSFVYGRAGARADFDIGLDLLARQGKHIAETVITHRIPLAEIARGFRTAADKTTGAIKVTITV